MHLTQAGEYAIRAMMHLASNPSTALVQIQEISSAKDIPVTFLRKLIPLLTRAGLIASVRGVGGGLKLARSADTITIVDVIESVEGGITLNRCLLSSEECSRVPWCAVHNLWSEAQERMKDVLRSKSLSILVSLETERRMGQDV